MIRKVFLCELKTRFIDNNWTKRRDEMQIKRKNKTKERNTYRLKM